ncbi:hypothetical protein DYB32_004522 [Aphanomyces invadans]|nr:hypothetical protein DYB32_004522 [Aphanomyces invadans]
MRFSLVSLQLLVALALLSSMLFVSKLSSSLKHDSAISMLQSIRFRRAQENQDSDPTEPRALDYASALDLLATIEVSTDDPYFVLLMSGMLASGQYWCSDCEQAKMPLARAFAATGVRHAVVGVGSREEWANASSPFRVGPVFHVNEVPALLRYDGDLHTTTVLTGRAFLSDEAMLLALLTPRPSPPTVVHVDTVEALATYFDEYTMSRSKHPLFVYFVSGTTPTGELWCPYCAKAELPVMAYFDRFAPQDAVLLRVVTAASLQDWRRDDNPFKVQQVIVISGLPMLIRAKPQRLDTAALEFEEYTAFFEDTALLTAFFQGAAYA